MGETCVIRLDGTGDPAASLAAGPASWAVVDDAGACLGRPLQGPLTDCVADTRGRRVVVLLPTGLVLRTRVTVPVRSGSRLLQALPFALEDTLADDVEDLHFAAGRRAGDGKVEVGVIRRDLLVQCLDALRGAGIEPTVIAAESDAVVDVPGSATLILEPGQVLLTEAGMDPVTSAPDGLHGLLELWLAQPRATVAETGLPAARNLLVYDATGGQVPAELWDDYRPRVQSLEVRVLNEGALPRLAAGAVSASLLNLLQGEFGARTSLAAYWPRWRLPAALAAGLAVVMLGAIGAEVLRLRATSARLTEDIQAATSYVFPDAPGGVDPRALLGGGRGAAVTPGGGQPFLDSLATVAAALSRTSDTRLESLNFRQGVLELQLRAPSADALDSIRKLVSEDGRLSAEIQSANASGDEILGRLRITSTGAGA